MMVFLVAACPRPYTRSGVQECQALRQVVLEDSPAIKMVSVLHSDPRWLPLLSLHYYIMTASE